MTRFSLFILTLFAMSASAISQVPSIVHVEILKAEDARRYDKTLEDLMKSPNAAVRERSALAAGRIGDPAAVPALVKILNGDGSGKVREMAAFALGEVESIEAADAIRILIGETGKPQIPGGENRDIRGRLAEAAGKIAAANAKDPKSKELGQAILFTLEAEHLKGAGANRENVLLALTAALRARPEGTDAAAAKFLGSSDARIRADAANTLSRVRAKNANEPLRKIAANDTDENARVNAIRALGAAEDKGAFDLLLNAATTDKSPAIRIGAIRSLAQLNDKRAVSRLIQHGRILMAAYPKSMLPNPSEKNELLEVATALGRIHAGSSHKETTLFLAEFQDWDSFQSPEVEIALARVSPALYAEIPTKFIAGSVGEPDSGTLLADWRVIGGKANGWREIANSKSEPVRGAGEKWLQGMLKGSHFDMSRTLYSSYAYSIPDVLRAYASYAPADLNAALLANLDATDVAIRSTAAELLGERPASKENIDALKSAFTKSLATDKVYNDAQFAILDALVKLNKKESVGTLLLAIDTADYLLRKKAFEILDEKELQNEFPGIRPSLEKARTNRRDQVLPYSPKSGTKLGQILNTDADYRRAVARKNGNIRAVFTTQKGSFTIEFLPEDAPLTVDNFVKLARANYFNGLEVHRVVPNFVMQDGDPRGDGNGGPGWSIRCEVNMVPYERGAVGMALSGKDTGGSQWFVAHLPQPHLDGGYTVFGKVNETGMKVVDRIVRGDRIVNVRIVEGRPAPRARR